jgi:hypothetical protein
MKKIVHFYIMKLILKAWMWTTRRLWTNLAFYMPNGRGEVKGVMLAHSVFDLKQMAYFMGEQTIEVKDEEFHADIES